MGLDLVLNIFNFELFGNEIWRYTTFLVSLIISYPIGKIIAYVINHYLLQWAKKTDWKFDDILIESINPPISMFAFAGLFYFGSTFINSVGAQIVLGKIFNLLVIIPVVYFMIKFSTGMVGAYLKDHAPNGKKVNEAAIDLLISLLRIILFAIGLLLILGNIGYDISALLAGLGVGGLAFALAAQDILKNFFAGISLIFDKTFAKGERVNFEGNSGKIEEVKLRTTKLRTYDGTLLTIPNAKLADNMVENVTKVPRVKVKMTIGVTYDTSSKKLKEAKKIIMAAVKENEHSDEKSTDIWFDNFGAYSLDIQVIYYAKELTMDNWSQRIHMKEGINFAIKEEFEKAKIDMAFPTQTVEIKKV